MLEFCHALCSGGQHRLVALCRDSSGMAGELSGEMWGGVMLGEASPSHHNPRTGEENDAGLKKPVWILLATTLMMYFVLLSCVDKNYQTSNKGEIKKKSV